MFRESFFKNNILILCSLDNHQCYAEYLKDVPGIIFQKQHPDFIHVHWMNAIAIEPKEFGHTKDQLINYLEDHGVDTRLLFSGMHRQSSLKDYGCNMSGDYPVTDWLTANGLYLPSASSLQEDTISYICELIKKFQSI